jgi:N-acetylglucosamine kinase-like BadF-type ATPase
VLIAAGLMLVAASLWLHSRQQPLDAQVAALGAQRAAAERDLLEVQARLEAARASVQDDGRVAALQADLAARQRVLELLGSGSDAVRDRGFGR